ncbi:bifunctional metallophosphatase/5'-nucleotidase, partial [Bullifex sp.]|uniref:bifunctional metallophosphatase/5'-nucleotidase n=1 Tax=Bullifex sp. TaxID=2815808 RepID=UPI002A7FE383
DIQGTIMTDDLANKDPDSLHPVIAAMNYMGYDAMTLGNHEFNWGITSMKKILSKADFPVLAANVKNAKGKYVTGAGTTIINRDGVKVAVIGVVTPDVPIWDGGKEGIEDYIFESAAYAVKDEIAKLDKDVDIIIVSAHMGTYAEFDEDNGSDSGLKILEVNPEVDVLQLAHNHSIVKESYNDVPVVATRNGGRDIAKVVLTLDDDNNIISSTYDVIDMKDTAPSEEIRSIPVVKELHEKAVNYVSGVGEDGEKGPALGVTTAKFQPENEIKGLPEGKLRDTAVMDLINMIQLEESGADVSAAALFKDTSDLPEGDINYGNIFDIYKFDNTLYRVAMTGKELKGYMEWAAACYNQWTEGDINISFDPDHPGYLYDMFAGVDYEIDLSQPAGSRIKNVMFNGKPLEDDQIVKVAVNNYRYSSAIKGQGLAAGKKEWESSSSIRDMIVAYFAANSPVTPSVDNNWKIVGVDLNLDDPRRAELVELINSGKLETPYAKSYNLKDYDELIKKAGN